ncbi:diacylglycerol kinase (ATP) [Roseimicrobium gellanilyticum]|uniref:Diacylglycerol kinase (ATP) n=1 Tax=Roseimicrobium gellanilyticum TaxID=748857 RepID=A0A366HJF3_9BACT|nr:diacylglycerol kinase family protein [Roseimicrobium gellanilyticum]RBP42374.1 diacylglycerol kinase (ATP) [Roseimicrobium gellanilyticum]
MKLTLKWSSFRCAFAGLVDLLKTQPHARWHLLASVGVVGLGLGLGLTRTEWLALIPAMALVWVAEAVNTAIELTCDAVTRERHPLIGRAKDLAAAAVLLAALFAVVVGGLVFLPRLIG